MPGEKPGPSPEEREEIEKERVLETARLIEGGAKFKVKEGKEPYFEVLRKQKLAAEEGYIRSLDPEERATKASEINEKTKAYLGHGKLEPGIFNKIAEYDIEYIYRQFPEGKIDRFRLVIGGKTVKRLKEELIDEEVGLGFGLPVTTLKNKEKIDLVRLTVADLGFEGSATIDQINQRAEELGLELCPPEVAPHFRLSYLKEQPGGDSLYIGMKPIAIPSHDDDLSVFRLGNYPGFGGRVLSKENVSTPFIPLNEFVFRLPKVSKEEKK